MCRCHHGLLSEGCLAGRGRHAARYTRWRWRHLRKGIHPIVRFKSPLLSPNAHFELKSYARAADLGLRARLGKPFPFLGYYCIIRRNTQSTPHCPVQTTSNGILQYVAALCAVCDTIESHHQEHYSGDLLLTVGNAIRLVPLFRENFACFNCAVVVDLLPFTQ